MAVYTTIDDPEAYFNMITWSGTGGSSAKTGVGFAPNLAWIKCRSATENHCVNDTVRGANKQLRIDVDEAESAGTDDLTAFGADGFTVGSGGKVNGSGKTYIAWNWLESATAGFDIVGYTGNGTDDTDISHSLSAIPHLIIIKNRSDTGDSWRVYHHKNTAAPETDYLAIDATAATVDNVTAWSDEVPTSSVFTLGSSNETNENTDSFITYLWSEKQGFSKFGSYEGNGNADGTFVYTGFRPAWVMTKSIDSTSSWHIFDDQRLGYNVDNNPLAAEVSTAAATTDMVDILSNGFKFRIATDPNVAETYIYAAFAKAPFVNSNGVPCNAR